MTEVIAQFLPNMLILFLSAFSATLLIGISVGVYSALHQYSLAGHLATTIAFFFNGAVVMETIFAWPGMGRLFIQSLESIDPPIIMTFTALTAISVVGFQIVADIVYAWVDPRIRMQ